MCVRLLAYSHPKNKRVCVATGPCVWVGVGVGVGVDFWIFGFLSQSPKTQVVWTLDRGARIFGLRSQRPEMQKSIWNLVIWIFELGGQSPEIHPDWIFAGRGGFLEF